jgi:succinoglycan biosynthesis transport protein ExoP
MNSKNVLRGTSELKLGEPQSVDLDQSVPYHHFSSQSQQLVLLDYWQVLVKRRWMILGSLVFTLAAAVLVSLRTTPMYQAAGQIMINRQNPNPLGLKESTSTDAVEDFDQTVDLATHVKILESNSLALQVVRKLQFDGKQFKASTADASNADPNAALMGSPQITSEHQAQLVGAFKAGLNVVVIPDTRVVDIRYSSPDPGFAADAVNALINTYIEQTFKTRFESTNQAAEWLTKQLSDLQGKVEVSEQKLVRYQKEHGIVGTDEKQNIITSKLDELNKELTSAEGDRIQKQALYELTLSGDPETVSTVIQNGFLQSLRGQQSDLRNQVAQATVRLGSAYPKVVELKNRLLQLDDTINTELKRAVSRIHNDYAAAFGREKMLRRSLEQQKQQANQLSENAIEYNLLKRDADSNRQLYDSLLQKLKEASLSAGLSSTNVHIVDLARPPQSPFTPDIPRNLGIGFLIGLTTGVALAFVLEVMDNTVRTPQQVEATASLPPLAVIPFAKGLLRDSNKGRRPLPSALHKKEDDVVALGVIAYTRPNSEMAEAYRALRTSILLSSPDAAPKVILVTSPVPEDGKTTTSVNSAIVFAREGRRVLLVDADLRRPSVHKVLGIRATAGLTTVLTGNAVPESLIIPSPALPNLFVLPAGPSSPHPSELLGSSRMKYLLAQWCEMFDHVILDLPPVLAVTDAVRLSVEAHAVVLVIRSGHTSKAALRRASALLTQVNAHILGVVVNALDLRSSDHYYSYYSGSKYAETHSEAEETDKASA